MSNKLIFASLLAFSATSSAAPRLMPPPAPPWIEERHELEPRPETNVVSEPTWEIRVMAGGAWHRHDLDASGRHATDASGHLSDAQIKELRDALAKASWHTYYTQRACPAFVTFERFVIDGTQRWATDTCSGLDADSAKAIAAIDKVLQAATAPKQVWLELRHQEEAYAADVPTWNIKLYTDGSFERHDDGLRGHPATDRTGRLSADQMRQLHAAIDPATWTETLDDISCAAVGTSFDTYLVGGKLVWSRHMCPTSHLDDASEKAIELIDKVLA